MAKFNPNDRVRYVKSANGLAEDLIGAEGVILENDFPFLPEAPYIIRFDDEESELNWMLFAESEIELVND